MSFTALTLISVVAIAVLVGIVVGILLLNRPKPAPPEPTLPTLDVNTLPVGEIPTQTRLEIYNIPMRLAALVVAPAGRGSELPEPDRLADLLDNLSPGLKNAFHQHQPKLLPWPSQLSSEGFVRAFFRHVPLPGDKGRGTPWCSLAGRIESKDDSVLVGLLCRGASSNSLGQIPIERPSKWLDVVRVRESDYGS